MGYFYESCIFICKLFTLYSSMGFMIFGNVMNLCILKLQRHKLINILLVSRIHLIWPFPRALISRPREFGCDSGGKMDKK